MYAFRRFASRRSTPRLMLSDNASTYLAAAEELQNLLSSAALENLSRRGIEWHFIPKRAPWLGALNSTDQGSSQEDTGSNSCYIREPPNYSSGS